MRAHRAMLLGALLVFFLVNPSAAWAQRGPLKIGFITDLTGPAA
jgi:hypothetical protein